MKLLQKLFKDPNTKTLEQMQKVVDVINDLEKEYSELSDDAIKEKTAFFKSELKHGKTTDDILPHAFATVREAAKRVMNMRHYDVQLMGGIALHQGKIAEMRTGEGKTLTSTLPIYLNALTEKGVHVVTVNDYLAARDAVWMGQIFEFLDLSVSCIQNQLASFVYDSNHVINEEEKDKKRDEHGNFEIQHDYLRPCSRPEAYQTDITYGTNNEFGFDYLRDNMTQSPEDLAQRSLAYALIDEIDSILIDEARTPLIISAPAANSGAMYGQFSQIVTQLKENEDYNIDEKMRSATLTEEGIHKVEKSLGVDNIYVQGGIQMVHHLEQALKAHTLFKKDKDYVVQNNEIIIVDEFTGRLMPGRRYSEGLHQAIEAKEGVTVQRESQTLATITFQNYFRLYDKLAGMTGTAVTEAEEFENIYKLETVVIPTNKQIARKDLPDKIFKNEKGKAQAIIQTVKELHTKGQPVLIGTVSIEKNEELAENLQKAGVPCQVLNAKNHEKEAQIIAQAGKKGAVTVATNMAGRGVDIVLGGQPATKESIEEVKNIGGLFVIGTERHESRRIDNQLRGRAGRQGDPGISQFFISMDDEVMRIFGSDKMKAVMNRLGLPDDMPIENKFITRSIESAQKRVEGYNFDTRKHVLEYDDVLNKHRTTIYNQRREILHAKKVSHIVLEMIENEIEQVVSFHTADEQRHNWNINEIIEVASTIFTLSDTEKDEITSIIEKHELSDIDARTKLIEHLTQKAHKKYNNLETQIEEVTLGTTSMHTIEKMILLRTYDTLWVEHLNAMHYLRIGIGLRGYGQRDPLIEYKKEAFKMFNELQNSIQRQVVYSIFKITFEKNIQQKSIMDTQQQQEQGAQKTANNSHDPLGSLAKNPYKQVPLSPQNISSKVKNESGDKIGRNDQCHCGSGKKYKKCCGQ